MRNYDKDLANFLLKFMTILCLLSFLALVVARLFFPNAEVAIFAQVLLATLGYLTGALSQMLGLPKR
jgi:hypothetical protein